MGERIALTVSVPVERVPEFYTMFGAWLQTAAAGADSGLIQAAPPLNAHEAVRPWSDGSSEQRERDAIQVYRQISKESRKIFDILLDHGGAPISPEELARISEAGSPQVVAGTLASVTARTREVGRTLPFTYDRTRERGAYRMESDMVTLFQHARTVARISERGAAAWIFQGNPKRFDIDRYLEEQYREGRPVLWTVQPRRNIKVGDRAYFWRADGGLRGSGGIIGVGTAQAEPEPLADDAPDLWAPDSNSAHKVDWRVSIRLDEAPRLIPSDGMILRVDLEGDARLGSLQILNFRALTVCSMSPEQDHELIERWRLKGQAI